MQAAVLSLVQLDRFFHRTGGAEEGDTMAMSSVVSVQSDDLENPNASDDREESGSEQTGITVSYEDTSWGGAGYHRFVTVTNTAQEPLSWEISTEHG